MSDFTFDSQSPRSRWALMQMLQNQQGVGDVRSAGEGAAKMGSQILNAYIMKSLLNKGDQEADVKKNAAAEYLSGAYNDSPAGLDPKTGITWNQARPDQSATRNQLMAQLLGPEEMAKMQIQSQQKANEPYDLAKGAKRFAGSTMIASNEGPPEAPKTDVLHLPGNMAVDRQWNAKTGAWEPMGQPYSTREPREPKNPQTVTTDKGIFILKPDGTLGNMLGDSPARIKNPRMQTYWDENGSSQTLDSNDPEDQKVIKENGLTSASPTDTQRTAKGFLDRMVAAEGALKPIFEKNPQVLVGIRDNLAKGVPIFGNKLVSDEYRQALQKIKDWARAKLRKESGAVIGDKEALDEYATYFGMYGDDPGTIAGKESSRLMAERQLATEAGVLGRKRLRELDEIAAKALSGSQTADIPQSAKTAGVDAATWNAMTPEQKALFK